MVGVNGVSKAPQVKGGRIKTRVGYIAQTIKSFEKALHEIFPQPFSTPAILVLSALLAPSIFSLGPNDLAKEPHSEAHSGRTTTSKSPFSKATWPGKAPFRGLGGRWWIGNQKKGNALALPLPMQRYDILRPIANR
mgnify:CR=1 FL=1